MSQAACRPLVSGVPVGDIPCYPKREVVIPQDLPHGSGAPWREANVGRCVAAWGSARRREAARSASRSKISKERVARRG